MRVAFTTLGCKVNQYDTATIESHLRREGCEIVNARDAADVYVVNTCTVTDRADAESRQLARRARRRNPSARVVMTGCYAQVDPGGAAIPEVDNVVGLNRLEDLIDVVLAADKTPSRIQVDSLQATRKVRTIGADTFTGQTRAFLKVQEGCDLFCTFCIVPFSRGPSRSVPPREVLQQLQQLAQNGFQEVVLTGVHLGGYGHDLEAKVDFCDLLEMIEEHSEIPRIRLSSIDPPEVSERLLKLVAESKVICPHFHIPMQSLSDPVLQKMRRQYDVESLRCLGRNIRQYLPDAAIGTDLIAGFPSESESDFDESLRVLEELPVTYCHVFPYSKRSGTTAAKLTSCVSPEGIRDRARQLREAMEEKRGEFARSFVGRELSVLIESARSTKSDRLTGYSENYQRVEVDGPIAWANQQIKLRMVGFEAGRLIGELA